MPSPEYCQDLLEEWDEAFEEAQNALDDYYAADDEMDSAAEDSLSSFVQTGIDWIGGDPSDAVNDWIDGFKGNRDFKRAADKAERAGRKFDRASESEKKKRRKWCDECGIPPEDTDSTDADVIDFSESEVDPILGTPF